MSLPDEPNLDGLAVDEGPGVPVVEKGVFGAYMQVSSINDGPVTFLLDSGRVF